MELVAILAAFEGACDGKKGSDKVQVPAELLLAAQHELKGKAQMAKDLEMARDEASMKPSVARKLNEKIRALESELEELRSNKRVKELERKVQILEHDLKQSYTTKNFTLKSGLLELEKQYRPHMNVDPAMAAFWDDIVVLLDEKKERDFHSPFQPKGPRTTAPSAGPAADTSSLRTPRASLGGSMAPTPAAAAAGGSDQSAAAAAAGSGPVSPSSQGHPSPSKPANASELQQSSSTVVQQQVESFNTIISEEAAGAAALLADAGSSKQEAGEVVVRHGAGFRVVRPAGMSDPHADVAAADGSTRAAAAEVSGAAEPAEQQQQQPQKLALLRQDFASKLKDVTFHAMPASQQMPSGDAAAAAAAQQPPAASALQQQSEAVSSSLQSLQAQISSMDTAVLPLPPAAGANEQQQAGEVDTASLWQHQLQRLMDAAAQLKQQLAEGTRSADTLQQQQAAAEGLLESVARMQAAVQGSSSSDPAGKQSLAAAVSLLSGLQQEVQELLRCVQRMAAEAGGQQLLVSVFKGFLSQLDQQGVLTPEAAGVSAAQQPDQQPAMLSLLQSFLQANPQVPQMLAVQLAPAVPPVQQPEQEPLPNVVVSSTGVQAVADAEHQAVQAVADAEHREVQAVADAEHREVQCQAAEAQHMATQSEPLPADHAETQTEAAAGPSDHVETQTEAAAGPSDHAGTQTEPGQADHTGTQTEPAGAPVSHVSTQAAAEAVSAGVQTTPLSPVAAAVQAELRPEVSEAGSQADLPAAAAAAQAQDTPAAAGGDLSAESSLLESRRQHGSGIIYSASGSELSVTKAAVGQQLDILHRIERSRAGDAPDDDEGVPGAAALLEVKPEELEDLPAVAKELGQLRAGNLELAASLQVEHSLVQHLNSSLKDAVDKADDAEAEAMQVKQQLDKTVASLTQLQEEHAEVTHLLIEAKVDNAERKGELLKLVRDLRRAISNPVQNAAGVVKELENILAVVPSADDDADMPRSPAAATSVSRQGSSFDMARQGGLAGLAAGLGHMRDALGGLGGAGRTRTSRLSDGTAAAIVAAGAEASAAAAAAKPAATLEKSGSGTTAKP